MLSEEQIQAKVAEFRRMNADNPLLPDTAKEYEAKCYEEILRQPPISLEEMEEQITRNRRLSESGRRQREGRRGT